MSPQRQEFGVDLALGPGRAPWFGPFFREEVQATAKIWKKYGEIRQTPDDLDAERQRLWKIKAKHDKEEQAKAAAANQKESP